MQFSRSSRWNRPRTGSRTKSNAAGLVRRAWARPSDLRSRAIGARSVLLEIVARSPKVTVLEGGWPYEEGITIEKFTSMAAVMEFWYSDTYQEAKKLREGASKINFIVAVEGAS